MIREIFRLNILSSKLALDLYDLFISFLVTQRKLLYRLTCIYAACKIEENHVSAEELGKGISQDHQMILNNEMIVYQARKGHKYQIVLVFFYIILYIFLTHQ